MIDEKKIERTANLVFGVTDNNPSIEKAAFIVGAQWAQEEFVKSLWHDASEEPKVGDIVVQIISSINNMPYYEITKKSYIYEWKYIVKCNGVAKWCYVSDLLQNSL